jgi:hypothetical protein
MVLAFVGRIIPRWLCIGWVEAGEVGSQGGC